MNESSKEIPKLAILKEIKDLCLQLEDETEVPISTDSLCWIQGCEKYGEVCFGELGRCHFCHHTFCWRHIAGSICTSFSNMYQCVACQAARKPKPKPKCPETNL